MNARAIFPTGRRYRLMRRPSETILPSSPRPVRRDCHGRLLTALLDRTGPDSDVEDSRITAWASATFIGARHTVILMLNGEEKAARAQVLRTALPEAEFAIPGHIVADLSVDGVEDESGAVRLTLSILTIEAW
jgi:hypothetical protein